MLQSVMAHVPNLEERIARLTAPNRVDGRFSGRKFGVDPGHIEAAIPKLQRDLIVAKVSGKLLLDEKDVGEHLTRREYLVQIMTLLSQLGLNIFLVHGGQEQLDRAIERSTDLGLSPEDKDLIVNLKDGVVRYTPSTVMPLIVSTSNRLSDRLKQDILRAGGNANAYLSSLFIGIERPVFTNPRTGEVYPDNHHPPNQFAYLPLDNRLHVIEDRAARVLRYLRGEIDMPRAAQGHIVIRGFLVNTADPEVALGAKRKIDPRTREKEDPFRRNGDADNIAEALAFFYSNRRIVPVAYDGGTVLELPERVHLLEIARNGGLRSGPLAYDSIVDVVKSRHDIERQKIEGGMEGKVNSSLRTAEALARKGVQAMVKIMQLRELLPYLLGNESTVRAGYGSGFGTTFAPEGVRKLNAMFNGKNGT